MSIARALWLTLACAPAGCFVEGALGVTPKLSQDLTDFAGTTTSSSHTAVTFSVWLGFHVDLYGLGIAYSPKAGVDAATAPAHTPSVATIGQHLRLDVDLPIHRKMFDLRATAAYSTVSRAEVDARGAMTATSSNELPNGKDFANSASGGTFFGGLSAVAFIDVGGTDTGAAVTTSLGITYRSVTSAEREDPATTTTIPGVSQSGFGFELRVMAQWQVPYKFFVHVPKLNERPTEHDPPVRPPQQLPDYRPNVGRCTDGMGNNRPCS